MKGLRPCYVTIANFKKDNSKGLIKVFKAFVEFLSNPELALFDEDTAAIDGSNFSGQNSKSNNYRRKKIAREIKHIENKVSGYLKELDAIDAEEQNKYNEERRLEVADQLEHLKERTKKYEGLEKRMTEAEQRGETQISTTDVDVNQALNNIFF